MSFIVHQKVRDKTYVYEAESYWDSEKKQSRQRRRYLGVLNEETGEIEKKQFKRTVRFAKDYGPSLLLDSVAGELDLREKLEKAFGDVGDELLALAMAKVIRPGSLKTMHHVIEDSFIPELYSLSGGFTSQHLSRLLESIGRDEDAMSRFYASLIQNEGDALVYDITSLSSYSRNLGWLEYGYNRDGLDIPQVNLGLVVSLMDRLPLMFKLFPGSVTDVTTLRNLSQEALALGLKKCLFILDRGFYSEENIRLMSEANLDFVMPIPFGRKVSKSLISETNKHILDSENVRMFKGDIYHMVKKKITIADVKLTGHLFFNKKRETDEYQTFYKRLLEIEQKLDGKNVGYGNPIKHFEDTAKQYARYFECTIENKTLRLRRRQKAIAQAENRFGKMILISSQPMPWDQALLIYREREEAERMFHQLKNELEILPLRVQKMETLRGLLFTSFLALLLRAQLLNKASTSGLLKKHSIEDIIQSMAKIRAVQIDNEWHLTEIPKKTRTILEKLNINIPVTVKT